MLLKPPNPCRANVKHLRHAFGWFIPVTSGDHSLTQIHRIRFHPAKDNGFIPGR